MDIAVCQNDGVQNLFDFLSVDADTDGEFTLEDGTVLTDGMMDPSAFDAGTYTVTYTVAAIIGLKVPSVGTPSERIFKK